MVCGRLPGNGRAQSEIDPARIRTPIGYSGLGCRLWALDVFFANCYGLLIYIENPPTEEVKARLRRQLEDPCLSVKTTGSGMTAQMLERRCAGPHRSRYRLVISFQRVNSEINPNGGQRNAFQEIDNMLIEGKF